MVRSLEVIGEAARSIPDELRARAPSVPWTYMAGTRNKLIHEYFGIDLDIIWQTIEEDLRPLEVVIQSIVDDLFDK